MPQQDLELQGWTSSRIHEKIELLINNLINIKDEGGKFLLQLPDGRIIDTKGWNDWEWTHGIGLYGLWQYSNINSGSITLEIIDSETNAPRSIRLSALKIIKTWFDKQLAKGTTKNINTMAPFLTLASIYKTRRNAKYLTSLEAWGEWAMHDLERTKLGGMQHVTYLSDHKGQLWADTLMMTALPLAKIGLVLEHPEYVEEAKAQFLLHITYLFDNSTGLFFHGWQFDDSKDGAGGHNFARARWARGNSWVTIAIPELLELLELPPNDSFRVHLIRVLEAQCRALRRLQHESGLWATLLDVPPAEGSYLESSATAGFAYGILKAVRMRYLPKEFLDCGLKAAAAVTGKINKDGELEGTSFGTGMGDDLEHYKKIAQTSMPYGQSMAIMALVEYLKRFW